MSPGLALETERGRWKRYPAYRDSGVEWLGEVPEGWDVTLLKREFDVQLGKMLQNEPSTSQDTLEPYLRAANIFWNGVDISDVKEMWFSPHDKTQYRIEKGDLVVSEGGDVGRSTLWRDEMPCCYIQNAINRIRSKGTHSTRFLYYWMYALKHGGYIDSICNKTTISHFTAEKVERVPVLLPEHSEQHAIAAFLDHETAKIDAMAVKKERLADLLEEKHTALISHVVTRGLDPDAPMKDSGIEWLGDVPAHWDTKHLRFLTQQDRPIRYGIVLPGPNVEDGVPIIKGGDVAPGRLRLDLVSRTSYEIEAKYARSRLRGGDLVYTIRGSIGMVEVVPPEIEGANLTQDAARVAPRPDVHIVWLLYTLKSGAVFAQLDAGAQGATIRGINIKDLKRALLPIPPTSEQRTIAAFLDRETAKIDALTKKIYEQIDKLKEYRTALISAAVTGMIDVRGEIP